ncbi:uncharacterized protein LJ264_007710 [Porphyrio hochstetteri]
MVKFLLMWPKYFKKVSEHELQPGDLLLVPIEKSTASMFAYLHAAAYCGEGEIIHLQKVNDKPRISKEGYEAMKRQRKGFKIFRKKGGINRSEFLRKVREAMNWKTEYNLWTNNCIRFALHLVDLADFYKEMVNRGWVSWVGWDSSCTHPWPALPLHPGQIRPEAGPWVVGRQGR